MANKVEIPAIDNAANTVKAPISGSYRSKSTFFNFIGAPFADVIGKGDQAKDSVVWYLITRMVRMSCLFIIILFSIDVWHNDGVNCMDILKQVWSVFAPVITLSMGYLFGKQEKNKGSKE